MCGCVCGCCVCVVMVGCVCVDWVVWIGLSWFCCGWMTCLVCGGSVLCHVCFVVLRYVALCPCAKGVRMLLHDVYISVVVVYVRYDDWLCECVCVCVDCVVVCVIVCLCVGCCTGVGL